MVGDSVLIVEDDQEQAKLLSQYLSARGYQVSAAKDGRSALAVTQAPDFILLDLGLPDTDGLTLCPRFQERFPGVLVMMLTARKDEIDRIRGLDVGADDYMVKPYSLAELAARLRALRRRAQQEPKSTKSGFVLDEARLAVAYDRQTVSLTTQEFELLKLMMRHRGRIFTRDYLLETCWSDGVQSDRAVDALVARLRRKLIKAFGCHFVITKHGYGYGFDDR